MDGTLLNSKRDISEANVKAMRKLKAQGVEIVLATGRTDLHVKDVAHRLDVTAPIISANGAMVRCIKSAEVLFQRYLPDDFDRRLAEFCFDRDYDCMVYSSDWVFHRPNSKRIKNFHEYNARVQPDFRVPLKEISCSADLPFGQVIKFFLWQLTGTQITELKTIFNKEGKLNMVSSEKNGLDVVAEGISKGEALRFLADKMGFDLKKTVVFGDNYNDISMLKVAGLPIAVANAEAEVRQIAKFVTRSNDEDGVAYAIQNYIFA
jgi:Cof subfamily protein (haloacid dehalogenase superfamily)